MGCALFVKTLLKVTKQASYVYFTLTNDRGEKKKEKKRQPVKEKNQHVLDFFFLHSISFTAVSAIDLFTFIGQPFII